MPKNQYPLPEFSTLIRWTVQDVINWLTQNNLTSCIRVFREYGIDGNKLINSTERDLINIECPRRESKEILNFINQVQTPRGNRGGGGYTQPQQPRYKPQEPQPEEYSDEGSGSDDDCGWSDNEFEDDNQDNYLDLESHNMPGPPPSRRKPSYQDVTIKYNTGSTSCYVENDEGANSDSSYEEPVETGPPPPRPYRPNQGGRSILPEPPRNNHSAPVPRRPPPPPSDSPESDEFYEDPDERPPQPSRPQPRGQVPLPPRPAIPVPSQEVPEEFYEEPDRPKVQFTHGGPLPPTPQPSHAPRSRGRAPVPPPIPSVPSRPSSDEMDQVPTERPRPPPPESMPKRRIQPEPEEIYEDPSDEESPPPVPISTIPKRHPIRSPSPDNNDQEIYEDPCEDEESSAIVRRPTISHRPPVKPPTPVVDSDDQEIYEDPSGDEAPPPAPISNIPKRKDKRGRASMQGVPKKEFFEEPNERPSTPVTNFPRRPNMKAPIPNHAAADDDADDDLDLYEDPDEQPPQTHGSSAPKRPLPRTPGHGTMDNDMEEDSDEDDYLKMDDGEQALPPPRGPRVPASNRGTPSRHREPEPPKPRHREPEPPKPRHREPEPPKPRHREPEPPRSRYKDPEPPQEDYEEPDSNLVKKDKPKKTNRGVAVLPMMNDLNLSNKMPDPPRGRRDILPPPQDTSARSNTTESKPETSAQLSEADYEKQKWYHKQISRGEAERQLKHYNMDGMYLIRKSSQGGDKPYTLQIIYNSQIYNLPIRCDINTGLFAMGKPKPGEKTFSNLLEIVNFFKRNYLVLSGGQQTTLVKSLPRT